MPTVLRLLCFIFFMIGHTANAQQCTGPGEPVAVIDFGSAGVPFSLAGKIGASYKIATEACTPEQTIAVRPKAFLCKPEWNVVPGDHTPGDDTGNFLMVNAAEGTSEIYRDTVTGLCGGTQFYAEAWIINLMRNAACGGSGGEPDLLFVLTDMAGNKIAGGAAGKVPRKESIEWV